MTPFKFIVPSVVLGARFGVRFGIRFGVCFWACLWPGAAYADWINLSGAETAPNIAEVYVRDDAVEVALEVYIGDLAAFEALIPDDWVDAERPGLSERLAAFARQGLSVQADGATLIPQVKLTEPRLRIDRASPFAGMVNPMTGTRVPEAPADKRVLYAVLEYPFEGQPDQLTISPPLDDEGRPEVSIGFIAYHKNVPVIDFRYLGMSAILNLNWDDPWYSKFTNPNLKRHHQSALMTFLYVEPYEVRHEILTRVTDLQQWLDFDLNDPGYIAADELPRVKQQVADYLMSTNPVSIDGVIATPVLDRIDYVEVSIGGIAIVDNPERIETATAILGVILAYPTGNLPQEVVVDWQLFTDQVQQVPATATDPAGPLPTVLTPDDNRHVWTNFLKTYKPPTLAEIRTEEFVLPRQLPLAPALLGLTALMLVWRWSRRGGARWLPIVAVLCVVGAAAATRLEGPNLSLPVPAQLAAELSPDQSQLLLGELLGNVYRAFDFREEDIVYDKLALSVSGDLLAEVYLQNRRSFAVQKAGGAQAKVTDVELLELTGQRLDEPLSYAFDSRWTASGSVGHWGHTHIRTNLYHAVVTVRAIEGYWKITGLELLSEERIDGAGAGSATQAGVTTGQSGTDS